MRDLPIDFLNARPVTPHPTNDEASHFYVCERCGQAVDYRRLGDVFHHDEPDHEPLPVQ